MIKKILVTGGAGFIGSAAIRFIIKSTNHSIINIDKLTYSGNLENLANVENNSAYTFEKVDICNRIEISRIFNFYQPDAVLHFAAESHVDKSISGPAEFVNTNVIGTYTLLEEAKEFWKNLDRRKKNIFRFLHVSTDEVYGDLCSKLKPCSEKTAYNPSSPYSSSKASSDHLVRAWHRTYKLPILVTNCSNNYGPYQHPEKLIPLVITHAIEGKKIPVYGNGKQVRDWIFVNDHIKALLNVLINGKIGETYNIGGNNQIKNIDTVKTICKILDKLLPSKFYEIKKYEQLISYVKDRKGHDFRYAIDISKINKELSWMPEETFESGIYKTVKWYLENKAWVKKVKIKNY